MAAALLTPGAANAALDNPAPEVLVSFTLDNGNVTGNSADMGCVDYGRG
ncbi:MAG: hypothetical protein WAL27_19890 [Cellulosimicrobium cellulans]